MAGYGNGCASGRALLVAALMPWREVQRLAVVRDADRLENHAPRTFSDRTGDVCRKAKLRSEADDLAPRARSGVDGEPAARRRS